MGFRNLYFGLFVEVNLRIILSEPRIGRVLAGVAAEERFKVLQVGI
ncbi:hypothetical protein [Gabonibacter chumensis]|nr:hypothetical protein [Gabonibacter chumensis]MCR9012903.1 hypothetical protein [Gabonibacter chumensis]